VGVFVLIETAFAGVIPKLFLVLSKCRYNCHTYCYEDTPYDGEIMSYSVRSHICESTFGVVSMLFFLYNIAYLIVDLKKP
jgi:hypothetical protein